MDCETVKKLLEVWWDGEIEDDEAETVRKHLDLCLSCRSQSARLEQLHNSIRGALEEKAGEIPFETFWAGIERRMAERKPWWMRLADWAEPAFGMQRVGWAISLAAILIIVVLSLSDFDNGWFSRFNGGRGVGIESIDAHGLNVAVFREAQTRTTVIWLFQDQESDDEAQEESAEEPATDDPPL